jgi:hypothetical protein
MDQQASEEFEKRLRQNQIEPLLTDGNDIESYFISAMHLHELNPMLSVEQIEKLIQQATADTAQKSIADLINFRTQKSRRSGGPLPNVGEIAVRAQADFEMSPAKYRRGKTVLGRLSALMQQEMGRNARVFSSTTHLRVAPITAIAHEIWAHPT